MPHFIEHHHVPRYRRCSRRRWHARPGRPARSGRFSLALSLQDFVAEFGDELLDSLNRANPPVYTGQARPHRQLVLASLKRKLFQAQAEVVHAVTELLADRGERAAIVNGEMGCGKTTVGIATAAVLHAEGYRRTWCCRRPTWSTSGAAKSRRRWPVPRSALNGPDTLVKLTAARAVVPARGQEFFVLGRVRMRMGFHWKPVFNVRRTRHGEVGTCPDCGQVITNLDGEPINPVELEAEDYRRRCSHCAAPLWTLMRPRSSVRQRPVHGRLQSLAAHSDHRRSHRAEADAQVRRLFLASMLGDNIHEFINLMDGNGELVFGSPGAPHGAGDGEHGVRLRRGRLPAVRVHQALPAARHVRPAHRRRGARVQERRLRTGPSDGVLAAKARKTLLLTGTLMGGYGDDLFHLLFRACRGE